MGMRAVIQKPPVQIYRINPRSGYIESVWYHGSMRDKPTGWSLTKPTYKLPR